MKLPLAQILSRIDIQALSGLRRILGVEILEDGLRAIELERRGSPLSKLSARFEVLSTSDVAIRPGLSAEEKGEALSRALELKGVKTKCAVGGMRGKGVRTVEATLSPSPEGARAWTLEHAQQLLKFPVAEGQFAFDLETLESTSSGERTRITFVRTGDIALAKTLLKRANLEVHSLMAGELPDEHPLKALLPAGVESRFEYAAELALMGFLPELGTVEFLGLPEREERSARTHKRLFERVALVAGGSILFALLVETLAGEILERRLSSLEEERTSLRPQMARVEKLKGQVTSLESRLQDQSSSLRRSDLARRLNIAANATPDDVRLTKLLIAGEAGGTLTLQGFARRSEGITRLIKTLSAGEAFKNARLIRSAAVGAQGELSGGSLRSGDRVLFEIRSDLSDRGSD